MPGPESPRLLPLAAVADAGPLIHLDELGAWPILTGFQVVLVPSIVAGEVHRHRSGWLDRAPQNVSVEDPKESLIAAVLREHGATELDRGEIAALALWETHRHAILLCDDLAARSHARMRGCEVTGTLGLLLWAARSGRLSLTEARALVGGLARRTSLHIHPDLVASALAELGRE